MKKTLKSMKLITLLLILSLALTACGKETKETGKGQSTDETSIQGKKEIEIGCMAITESIVEFLGEGLEKDGYKIKPVVFDGNHLPATALRDGDVDGVILNHLPWLKTFNKENNADLIMPEPYMYYSVNAIRSLKYSKLEDIPNGAMIAVPGDPVNLERSLEILEKTGFIKLGEKTSNFYSLVDIEDNLKDIEILETEITATTRSIEDVDAIITGATSMRDAGYDHKESLYEDPTNKDYPLGLIIENGNEQEDWVKAVLEYQETDEFQAKFNERYDQTFVLYKE